MKKPLLILLSWSIGQALTGCVVYMPMQCAAPQLTDRKQGEITASTYLNDRYDFAGAYSPVRHLLVRATYSTLSNNSNDSTYYRGHQYDVGVGTYWRLGNRWLVGGLGGFGQAHSAAAFSRTGIFFLLRSTRTTRATTRCSGKPTPLFRPMKQYPLGPPTGLRR